MLDQVLDVGAPKQRHHRVVKTDDFADDGNEAILSNGEPDVLVSQRNQVPQGKVHRGNVVVGDERRLHPLEVTVDKHDRQTALAQRHVAPGVRGGVCVQPADVDDPGHAAFEEHQDVVVLV